MTNMNRFIVVTENKFYAHAAVYSIHITQTQYYYINKMEYSMRNIIPKINHVLNYVDLWQYTIVHKKSISIYYQIN